MAERRSQERRTSSRSPSQEATPPPDSPDRDATIRDMRGMNLSPQRPSRGSQDSSTAERSPQPRRKSMSANSSSSTDQSDDDEDRQNLRATPTRDESHCSESSPTTSSHGLKEKDYGLWKILREKKNKKEDEFDSSSSECSSSTDLKKRVKPEMGRSQSLQLSSNVKKSSTDFGAKRSSSEKCQHSQSSKHVQPVSGSSSTPPSSNLAGIQQSSLDMFKKKVVGVFEKTKSEGKQLIDSILHPSNPIEVSPDRSQSDETPRASEAECTIERRSKSKSPYKFHEELNKQAASFIDEKAQACASAESASSNVLTQPFQPTHLVSQSSQQSLISDQSMVGSSLLLSPILDESASDSSNDGIRKRQAFSPAYSSSERQTKRSCQADFPSNNPESGRIVGLPARPTPCDPCPNCGFDGTPRGRSIEDQSSKKCHRCGEPIQHSE